VSIATADPSKPPAARELVVEGPRVTLRGAVGDRAGAEAVVGKVATVLGAGNVAADFAVDPRAQPTEVPVRAPSVTTFAGATNDYTPGFTQLLDTVATLAKAFPAMRVTVYGYTDDQGSAADNRTTAQRRADAAVQALVDRGVDRARLRTVAKGPADPIASNATPDGRLRNRRVELGVVGLF
jgi:outer membrane protein OmpA-like peptidoglycan-associated protein